MRVQARGWLQRVLCVVGFGVLVAVAYDLYAAGTFQAWYALLWALAVLLGMLGTRRSRCALRFFPPLGAEAQFALLVVVMLATVWAVHGRFPSMAAWQEVFYLFFPLSFLWEGVVWFYRRF